MLIKVCFACLFEAVILSSITLMSFSPVLQLYLCAAVSIKDWERVSRVARSRRGIDVSSSRGIFAKIPRSVAARLKVKMSAIRQNVVV